MLVLGQGEDQSTQTKTSSSKDKNQQQNQIMYDVSLRNKPAPHWWDYITISV